MTMTTSARSPSATPFTVYPTCRPSTSPVHAGASGTPPSWAPLTPSCRPVPSSTCPSWAPHTRCRTPLLACQRRRRRGRGRGQGRKRRVDFRAPRARCMGLRLGLAPRAALRAAAAAYAATSLLPTTRPSGTPLGRKTRQLSLRPAGSREASLSAGPCHRLPQAPAGLAGRASRPHLLRVGSLGLFSTQVRRGRLGAKPALAAGLAHPAADQEPASLQHRHHHNHLPAPQPLRPVASGHRAAAHAAK